MLRLILVRHGRTAWNVLGRVQGGGPLDDVGRAQVSALAERLSREPISAVYSSPAARARETAGAIAERLGLPVRRSTLLRDLSYGRFAGALLTDVEARYPGLLERWRASPHTVRFEGGESIAELRGRIVRFIARTHERHDGETVLAATHDSPVRVAASLALGLDDAQHTQERLRTQMASVTELRVDGQSMELTVHNEVGHLQGIDGGL
ncbi:MAG: histidine phosphatase family protein [Chloroflexi bacterium]|nr:histidine phosphatase family protein [Chloroflexota bacterium]MCH7655796.1 histidine phosphatase family protein [Chloroflexota bacterium]